MVDVHFKMNPMGFYPVKAQQSGHYLPLRLYAGWYWEERRQGLDSASGEFLSRTQVLGVVT